MADQAETMQGLLMTAIACVSDAMNRAKSDSLKSSLAQIEADLRWAADVAPTPEQEREALK